MNDIWVEGKSKNAQTKQEHRTRIDDIGRKFDKLCHVYIEKQLAVWIRPCDLKGEINPTIRALWKELKTIVLGKMGFRKGEESATPPMQRISIQIERGPIANAVAIVATCEVKSFQCRWKHFAKCERDPWLLIAIFSLIFLVHLTNYLYHALISTSCKK
uniref:Uncharacterized protein n=1 Tax=Glossina pallidipes TaxID=7398 RepID=A0A1A9ZZM6_GLOPL